MARKPLSQKRSELAEKMVALQEQMEQLEQDEIEAVGRIAKESGLIGLDIPEKQLKETFKEIAV